MIKASNFSLLHHKHKGSAYLELVLVFVFLAAIFGIMIPTYFNYVDKAKLTLASNTVHTIGTALKIYHRQHRTYPENIDFTTGKDPRGLAVFTNSLLDQIASDFSSIESYVGTSSTFTLTVTASDKHQTPIVLTPSGLSPRNEP